MKKVKEIQYTVRNVPPSVDRALRRMAEERQTSLNALLVGLLTRIAGASGGETLEFTDLDALIGSWIKDPDIDAALKAQGAIDPELWR